MMITSRTSLTRSPREEGSPTRWGATPVNVSTSVDVPSSRRVWARHDRLEPLLLARLDQFCRGERTRLALDRLQLGWLDPGDPVILETPSLDQNLALERADGLVVRLDRSLE